MTCSHVIKICETEDSFDQVEANAQYSVAFEVTCSEGCCLGGKTLRILDSEGAPIREARLEEAGAGRISRGEFLIRPPEKPGCYHWRVFSPQQVIAGIPHGEAETPFPFTVQPHLTSLAVWGIPSNVAANTLFRMKVGAKCIPASCSLTDAVVVIRNQNYEWLAETELSSQPFPGTLALHWAEIEARAPRTEGVFQWEALLLDGEDHLPSSHRFSFLVSRTPERSVTFEVAEAFTRAPIPGAVLLLDRHQGTTDPKGVGEILVPKGRYHLTVAKDGYHTCQSVIQVEESKVMKIELSPGPSFSYSDLGPFRSPDEKL